jgi:hypothetical protein
VAAVEEEEETFELEEYIYPQGTFSTRGGEEDY